MITPNLVSPWMLDNPVRTAIGHWARLGRSSTSNPVLASAAERLLRPYGVSFDWLQYDAFAPQTGKSGNLYLVNPKLDLSVSEPGNGTQNLWQPIIDAGYSATVILNEKFNVEIALDNSVSSPALTNLTEQLQAGYLDELNQNYQAIIMSFEIVVNQALKLVMDGDKSAIRMLLRAPDELVNYSSQSLASAA